MSDQLSRLVYIIGITTLIAFVWAASIAFTYWDTHRLHLPGARAFAWLLLVTLLPVIGFMVYLIFRAVPLLLPMINNKNAHRTRRETALKHPLVKKSPMPTILAAGSGIEKPLETQNVAGTNAGHSVTKMILTVSSGAELGREFIIGNLPATVGRGSGALIRLDSDLGVSRLHAEIYEQAGSLRIRDLKSTHGTKVNGLPIEDHPLLPGDCIQIGQTVLELKIIEAE